MTANRIEYSRFAVNETPYCYWMNDIHGYNKRVIQCIDPDYWHSASYMIRKCAEKNEIIAAVHSRMYYLTSLETMFAHLFSLLQAPDCIMGWLHNYGKRDIKRIINKIDTKHQLYTKLELAITWKELTHFLFSDITQTDAKLPESLMFYERYLRMFANEIQSVSVGEELNSIKHGLRVNSGGFGLAFGPQEAPGIPAPPEKMMSLGSSATGMTYWIKENIGSDKKNYGLREKSVNWTFDSQISRLELIAVYMNNIKHMMLQVNGYDTENTPKMYVTEHEKLQSALSAPLNAPHAFDFKAEIHPEWIKEFTTAEVLSVYDKPRYRRVKN